MNIKVDNLRKRYGKHFELHVPSLEISAGETVGLVGNNGAGKTTFLRLLLDLIRSDGGAVYIDGKDVKRDGTWKADTGSYLDDSFLLDFLSADEYFDFVGAVYGLSRTEIAQAVAPFRPFFTDMILGQPDKYIRDLSLGNAKKVGIVAAMLSNPRLLILDEPFANLDPGSQIQLKMMLAQMNMQHNTTLLISSHDLQHVTEICQRIAILDGGRIVSDQDTSEETLQELELYFATRLA
ncbi:MAG TPA: ABC transporter ATP-binding protein [Rhodothermales bacterium]